MALSPHREADLMNLVTHEGYEGILLRTESQHYWYPSAKLVRHAGDPDDPDDPESHSWTEIAPSDKDHAKVLVTEDDINFLENSGRIQNVMFDFWLKIEVKNPRRFVCFRSEA